MYDILRFGYSNIIFIDLFIFSTPAVQICSCKRFSSTHMTIVFRGLPFSQVVTFPRAQNYASIITTFPAPHRVKKSNVNADQNIAEVVYSEVKCESDSCEYCDEFFFFFELKKHNGTPMTTLSNANELRRTVPPKQ